MLDLHTTGCVVCRVMTKPTALPQLLSAQETADYLGTSVWTVKRLLTSGQIPGKRLGGRWYINADLLAKTLTPGVAA